MPIYIVPFLDADRIGLRFAGESFYDCVDLAKENFVQFKKTFEKESNVWIMDKLQARALLPLFKDIEEFSIPDHISEWLERNPETKFARRRYDENLLKSTPLGTFQEKGIRKAISQNRFYFAWEMGLGKTFAVVSTLNHLFDSGAIDKVLIVTPPESLYNFRRELLRFNSWNLKDEDIYIANVDNRDPFPSNPQIILMTFRTFLMLSDEFYFKKTKKKSKEYRKPPLPFDQWGTKRAVVIDESHKLKNPAARQTKALSLHKEMFEFRYLLSGTPDPNGIEGYYSQLAFLDEEIIGKHYLHWLRTVANLGNRFSKVSINFYYPDKVERFVDSVKPWVDRQFTKDNIELPDLLINPVYVRMGHIQEKIYQQLVAYVLHILKEEDGEIIPKKVIENFPFLIQAVDNPSLLKGKIDRVRSPVLYELVRLWKFKDHCNIESLTSLLETYINEENRKVILWTGHPKTADELVKNYSKYEPFCIHGQTEIPKGRSQTEFRNELLEEYKKSKTRNLMIASYKVLSSAVNIVESTRSIYFDRSFDYTEWAQSIKRNHRIGQTETVLVNPFIVEDTISILLEKALQKKDDINRNLFKRESLSQAEWKKIFLGDGSFLS